MDISKSLALKYFDAVEGTKCQCGGAHEVCLNCVICRRDQPDQTVNKVTSLEKYIDHTKLNPDAVEADIRKLCEEAVNQNFKAVCVNPVYVELCSEKLGQEQSLVCSVIGFPLGASLTGNKNFETLSCIENHADEIDMVINIGNLKDRQISCFYDDIVTVAKTCIKHRKTLKVIIETCLLSTEEKVIASLAAKKAGADFVKTSTGFSSGGATIDDVALIRKTIGPKYGVKASGGIRTAEDALKMLKAGANRLGTSKSIEIIEGFCK